MRHTARKKRHSKIFDKMRQKREKRRTRRMQRGGNPQPRPLLDGSDAPPVVPQGQIDFNVRFQPTLKADENGPSYTTYQTAHEPYPVWTAPKPPVKYTIICWDPDVKEGKSFLHWLVVNCAGADNSDGKVIASWQPPSPPPGSGEHRYIIGLMKQNSDLNIPEMTERLNFNPTTFATTNGLSPIAYRGFRVDTPPIFVPGPPAPGVGPSPSENKTPQPPQPPQNQAPQPPHNVPLAQNRPA